MFHLLIVIATVTERLKGSLASLLRDGDPDDWPLSERLDWALQAAKGCVAVTHGLFR